MKSNLHLYRKNCIETTGHHIADCLLRHWIKERGIIVMRVKAKSGTAFCSLTALANGHLILASC